jgi:hypothetical protein
MRLKAIFIFLTVFLFFNTSPAISQKNTISLSPMGTLSKISLKPNYAYYFFKVNNDYLVWYEGYTHTIFIYNFTKKILKKIILKKGRGPHEFLQISGISISKSNIIYLVDNINVKFIRLRPTGKFLKDYVNFSALRVQKTYNKNDYQIIKDINSQKSLFFLQLEANFIPLKLKSKVRNEFDHNIYKKLGRAAIQEHYLIQVLEYLPNLYVYDLNNHHLTKKIKFDDSKVDWGQPQTNNKGAKMMLPPSHVNIKNEDIAAVPGEMHCVFLLAKGAGKHREYGLNKLWEYNWKIGKFVGLHNLPFKVQEIATNDQYLFAYSKEKNKIYQFKVVPPK